MKKLLLTISAITSSALGLMAQTPSMDMEIWVNDTVGTLQDPRGWASFNPASAFGMNQSVFKITSPPADVYQGTASAKIVTVVAPSFVAVPNPFRPGHNFDTVGILSLGSLVGTTLKFGKPLTIARPAVLSFASKYTPGAGDSAYVVTYLTHWNTINLPAHRDTVARGIYRTGDTTTTYSMNSITLTYDPSFPNIVPDTQMIHCSSSKYSKSGAKPGSTFFVDEFQWSGYNSINDLNGISGSVSFFPNPASNEINFSSTVNANYVEVSDITGRRVGLFVMQNNKVKIPTESFTPGLYIYSVLNDKKEAINRGKFEVAK